VLVGSANYEDASNEGASVLQYDLNSGAIDQAVPAVEASVGALAVSDLDGDGNLDLFVGGRVLPGKYPEAASSTDLAATLENSNSMRLILRSWTMLGWSAARSGATWMVMAFRTHPRLRMGPDPHLPQRSWPAGAD